MPIQVFTTDRRLPTPRTLTTAQLQEFVELGYVVLRDAFRADTAAALAREVWARLPEAHDDPASWTRHAAQIEDIIRSGPLEDIFTGRYESAIDDLVGAGRWWTRRDGFGWVTVRFPNFGRTSWLAPAAGWHVDGMHFQHHLTSPEQGLVALEMLTDAAAGGGGTCVKVGSHRIVARWLAGAEPNGLAYDELRTLAERDLRAVAVEQVRGSAGDVLLMHPFLAHARGPNVGSTVRIAANRCIALHAPMSPSSATSWVEHAIELALR